MLRIHPAANPVLFKFEMGASEAQIMGYAD